MRRYLIGTPTEDRTCAVTYEEMYIIEAVNADLAVDRYNEIFDRQCKYGVVIATVKEDMTTKYVRSGSIDIKTMLRVYENGNFIPYNYEKDIR